MWRCQAKVIFCRRCPHSTSPFLQLRHHRPHSSLRLRSGLRVRLPRTASCSTSTHAAKQCTCCQGQPSRLLSHQKPSHVSDLQAAQDTPPRAPFPPCTRGLCVTPECVPWTPAQHSLHPPPLAPMPHNPIRQGPSTFAGKAQARNGDRASGALNPGYTASLWRVSEEAGALHRGYTASPWRVFRAGGACCPATLV